MSLGSTGPIFGHTLNKLHSIVTHYNWKRLQQRKIAKVMLSSSIGIKESIKKAKNPDYGQLRAGSVKEFLKRHYQISQETFDLCWGLTGGLYRPNKA